MSEPHNYTYQKYLRAKQSVDERALNQRVWTRFVDVLSEQATEIRLLEVGPGVGTTAIWILKALRRSSVERIEYTLLDVNSDNLTVARERLRNRFPGSELSIEKERRNLLHGVLGETNIVLEFVVGDLTEAEWTDSPPQFDAVVAQAVFDLLPLPETLRVLRDCLREGGIWYLPIHFDGITAFEPQIDPALDEQIEQLYHDRMLREGQEGPRSDGAQTGRRLLVWLREIGADLLEAGSSDWVVFGREGGYPQNEEYFLYHILHFIEQELAGHPALDTAAFDKWMAKRRQQIENQELIYVAHQLDVLARQGRYPSHPSKSGASST